MESGSSEKRGITGRHFQLFHGASKGNRAVHRKVGRGRELIKCKQRRGDLHYWSVHYLFRQGEILEGPT